MYVDLTRNKLMNYLYIYIYIYIYVNNLVVVKLEFIYRSKYIDLELKFKLYKSLVIFMLLYGCKTWELLENSKKKLTTFEFKAHIRLLNIKYRYILYVYMYVCV